MSDQTFTIQSLLFDIEFSSREKTHELQNRVSRLFASRLSPMITNIFNEAIPEELTVTFNVLTLDLGNVAYNNLENEIEDNLLEAMRKAFPHSFTSGEQGNMTPAYSTQPSSNGYLQVLESFLLTGFFPWWATVNTINGLQQKIFELFESESGKMTEILLSAGQKDYVRKRLTYQFSESFVHKIIHLLEPAEADFIFNYHETVKSVHKKSTLIKSGSDEFNKEVLLFILTFLLTEKGSTFSRKEFIKSAVSQIAAHFSIRYEQVLLMLKQALDSDIAFDEEASLTRLLRTVIAEHEMKSSHRFLEKTTPSSRNLITPAVNMQWLKYFFATGNIPGQDGSKTNHDLKELLAGMIDSHPGEVKKLLHELAGDIITARLYSFQDKNIIEKLIHLLEPSQSKELMLFSETLKEIVAKILANGYFIAEQTVLVILVNFALSAGKLDGQKFLEYAIDQLSLVANVNASVITQSVLGKFQSGKSFSDKLALMKLQELNARGREMATGNILQAQELNSLLRHFLLTGTLPWWSLQKNLSVREAIERLYVITPKIAVQLLQWAGAEKLRRERFMLQFPVDTIKKIIGECKAGSAAVKAFNYILEWQKKQAFLLHENFYLTEKNLLGVIWEQLLVDEYKSFDENKYYLQIVVQIWQLVNIHPYDMLSALMELVENHDLKAVADALQSIAADTKKKRTTVTALSSEVLEKIIKQRRDANVEVVKPGIISILSSDLEYFFLNNSFPQALKEIAGFSTLVYLKSALFTLYKSDINDFRALLEKHLQQSGSGVLVQRIFSMDITEEQKFLRLMNDISQRHKVHSDTDASYNEIEIERNIPESFPLLHEYYFGNDKRSEDALVSFVREKVDFFLTWKEHPTPLKSFGSEVENELLKEAVLFLFNSNRTALISLLQNEFHSQEARMELFNLFKFSRGGKDALIASFFKPYLKDALLDLMWEADKEVKPENFSLPMEEENQGSDSPEDAASEENISFIQSLEDLHSGDEIVMRKAGELLDYYLTYGKLPDTYNISAIPLSDFIIRVIRFIFFNVKDRLSGILSKRTHNADTRMKIHEWFFSAGHLAGKELTALMNNFLPDDMLLYFSKHTNIDITASISELLEAIINSQNEDKKKAFIRSVVSYPVIIKYLASVYERDKLYKILEEFDVDWKGQFKQLTEAMERFIFSVLSSNYEQHLLNLVMKEFNLLIVSGKVVAKHPADVLSGFFDYLDYRRPAFVVGLYNNLQNVLMNDDATFESMEPSVRRRLHKEIVARKTKEAGDVVLKTGKKDQPVIQALVRKRNIEPDPSLPVKKEEVTIEKGTKMYIVNAGLVLLHPFINTYLSLTGLVLQNKFIDENAQQRAVHLLQYLVYGSAEHEEQALVLNKILCGLPLEQPLPRFIELTEKEKSVTSELFKIVFQRWEKMKNSTVDGFRASFLQREAVLVKGEEVWKMRVEQKGYDLLLQTLPWSFGLIKQPWMPQALEVEWI